MFTVKLNIDSLLLNLLIFVELTNSKLQTKIKKEPVNNQKNGSIQLNKNVKKQRANIHNIFEYFTNQYKLERFF